MKKVLLLTDVDFWNEGAGHRMRIARLVEYISTKVDITVIFLDVEPTMSEDVTRKSNVKFMFPIKKDASDPEQNGRLLKRCIKGLHFDFIMVEYIHNAFYLGYLPSKPVKILDAHDIISERTAGFQKYDYGGISYELSEEVEYDVFTYFDHILFLCDTDCAKVKKKIKSANVISVPHSPILYKYKKMSSSFIRLGFIGSQYLPNKDGIEFFIENCWDDIASLHGAHLYIYGNISYLLQKYQGVKNIHIMGYTRNLDDFYKNIDIAINPVRFGAGVKIKNLEAIANGVPLITTSHGANGLENEIGKSFLVANNPAEFKDKVSGLIKDRVQRKKMSIRARRFANVMFNENKCYENLMHIFELTI